MVNVGYSLARTTCLDFFLLYEVALPLAGVEITAECLFNHSTIRLNTPKYQKVTIYLSLKMGHWISVSWSKCFSILLDFIGVYLYYLYLLLQKLA